jgi:hypothetical protein
LPERYISLGGKGMNLLGSSRNSYKINISEGLSIVQRGLMKEETWEENIYTKDDRDENSIKNKKDLFNQ